MLLGILKSMVNEIKRAGIFCFYEKDGIVDDFVEYLLQEMEKCVDKLYIIVNGELCDSGRNKLNKYSHNLYIRNNVGFDGGAYADFFVNYIDIEEISSWDELVIFNDTFFGPIISVENIFEKMSLNDVDFWGMRYVDRNVCNYIESYFLVFRSDIVKNRELYYYFVDNYIYLCNATYRETCSAFERGLFGYLTSKGYSFGSFVKDNRYDIFFEPDVNMVKCGLPIIKKKCLNTDKYSKSVLDICFQYIISKTDYDINLIYNFYERVYEKKYILEEIDNEMVAERIKCAEPIPVYDVTEERLLRFLRNNNDIYIYGAGFIAGNVWWEYKYYIINMKGFVVSDKKHVDRYFGLSVYSVDDIPVNSNIIVALGKENAAEVAENIIYKHNTLFLYDINI